jgi:methyl-accepting chemotaxis protein
MRHQQENDAAFLRRLADDIRSLAEEAPEAADELRAISNEIDAEVQQQNEAALRRRDFSSSTRSLSARLATGS